MPARVHALLVVRSDADPWHVERTLDALAAQEHRADAVTIVACGTPSSAIQALIAASGAEGVIAAPRHTSFAQALRLASHRLTTHAANDATSAAHPPATDPNDAVWLLAHDSSPEPAALRRLAGALEANNSAAIVAPKLVERTDPDRIVSLGVTITTLGRTVQLVDGYLDQGQYDHLEDALGADIRGMLVRRTAWNTLNGVDPALAGADEGLDLAVRARLAGDRVTLVPAARVAVSSPITARVTPRSSGRTSPASGTPDAPTPYAARTAQLQRRLAYAPAITVPLHWLSIPFLAIFRSVMDLIRKAPASVLAEWAAAATVMVRWGAIARSRSRIRSASRATGTRTPWSQLAPLRITRGQLHHRLDGPDGRQEPPATRGDLHFFIGGGAWTVLAALVAGLAVFIPLLTWPSLGGGGLLPLRSSLTGLWTDAAFGRRALGLDTVGAADPFAAVVAVFGSLTPWNPSQAIVILWLLAFPLAALGGWFAATRLTARPGMRITGAVIWTLAPMFLIALVQGRPSAVIVHLLLPWLFYTATAARRSWASAGAASILTAAIAACSPSLVPALLVIWLIALLFSAGGVGRIFWLPLPTLALFAPLIWERGIRDGDWWGLLADPGVVFAAAQNGTDAVSRALLVAGLPTPDLGGWTTLLPFGNWAWVLVLPLGLAAVSAFLTARLRATLALVGLFIAGVGTAMGAVMITVQSNGPTGVALWPGAALSVAWLAVMATALIALNAPAHRRVRAVAPTMATVISLSLAVLAVPVVIAPVAGMGGALIRNGPTTTLPAYVAAAGQSDPDLGTLVITPLSDTELAVRLVWGSSETLGGTSTAITTQTVASAGDEELAAIATDLVSPGALDPTARLAAVGVGFILIAPSEGSSEELALQGTAAMDARASLESVGDTSRGSLWRVRGDIAPRAEASPTVAGWAGTIGIAQLLIFGAAALLAVPTLSSRRAARGYPRLLDTRTAAATFVVRPGVVTHTVALDDTVEAAGPVDAAVPVQAAGPVDAALPVDASVPESPAILVTEPDASTPETDSDSDSDVIETIPLEPEPEFAGEQASVTVAPRDGVTEAEDLVDPEASGGDRDDPWEERP